LASWVMVNAETVPHITFLTVHDGRRIEAKCCAGCNGNAGSETTKYARHACPCPYFWKVTKPKASWGAGAKPPQGPSGKTVGRRTEVPFHGSWADLGPALPRSFPDPGARLMFTAINVRAGRRAGGRPVRGRPDENSGVRLL